MSERNRVAVAMHFGDGSTIDTWHSLTLKDSFTDPLGSLELETIPPRNQYRDYRQRLAKGELVTVLVNGVSQGGFLIQTVDRTLGDNGMAIKVSCHTPLITPYQGHVDPDLSFKSQTDVPVENVVLTALTPFGFNAVAVDANAHVDAISGRPLGGSAGIGGNNALTAKNLKHQAASAQNGETAYQFCARIFTRLGVALRCSADGTLLLSAPNYDQPISASLVRDMGTSGRIGDRFIGDVHVHDTNDDQFSECTVRGLRASNGDPATLRPVARVTAEELSPNRPAYSSTPANFKPKIFRDKSSRDKARCTSVCKFELGMRAKDAFTVTGEVDGWLSQSGMIWTVDTMVSVYIEAEDIDEPMYLVERTLIQDTSGGQKARLKLIPKGALILGDVPR